MVKLLKLNEFLFNAYQTEQAKAIEGIVNYILSLRLLNVQTYKNKTGWYYHDLVKWAFTLSLTRRPDQKIHAKVDGYHMYQLGKSHTEERHVVAQKIYNAICITNDLKLISFFHACPKNVPDIHLKWAEIYLVLLPTSQSLRARVGALIALKRLKTREVTIINVSHKWLGTSSLTLSLFRSLAL